MGYSAVTVPELVEGPVAAGHIVSAAKNQRAQICHQFQGKSGRTEITFGWPLFFIYDIIKKLIFAF